MCPEILVGNDLLKMNLRRWEFGNCSVWMIFIMSLLLQSNAVSGTIPCEFLYGGCQHNGENFYPPPPVLTLQHHSETMQYNQQVYLPSPPGKPPRCAKQGLTFCEKIDKYPGDLIRTLVAKTNYDFKSLFADESEGVRRGNQRGHFAGSDFNNVNVFNAGYNQSSQHGDYPDRQYHLDESSIHIVNPVLYAYNPHEWWRRSERAGRKTGRKRKRRQSPAGTELCPTRSQFIQPQAALNTHGEWKYVVNVEQANEKYTQLVRSETCLTSECNGICSLPNGYTSRCEQKYVQKRLVALKGSGSNLYTDVFWFPHCCICQIAPDIR